MQYNRHVPPRAALYLLLLRNVVDISSYINDPFGSASQVAPPMCLTPANMPCCYLVHFYKNISRSVTGAK